MIPAEPVEGLATATHAKIASVPFVYRVESDCRADFITAIENLQLRPYPGVGYPRMDLEICQGQSGKTPSYSPGSACSETGDSVVGTAVDPFPFDTQPELPR